MITEKYLLDSSENEINLPNKPKEDFLKIFKEYKENKDFKIKILESIEKIQKEIKLNLSDPFSRFLNDSIFREMVFWMFSESYDQYKLKLLDNSSKKNIILNELIDWSKDQNFKEKPLILIEKTLKLLKNLIILKDFWIKNGSSLDYENLIKNRWYLSFIEASAKLKVLDISNLNLNEKKVFFLNLYNLLILHGSIVFKGDLNTIIKRCVLVKEISYNINEEFYSPDYILNTIFRVNF